MSRLNTLACRTIVGNLRRQRIPKGGVRLYVARKAAARATYLRASLLRDYFAGVDCGAILPTRDTAGTRQQAQAQPEPCPISLPASSGWSYCSQLLPVAAPGAALDGLRPGGSGPPGRSPGLLWGGGEGI
jgi:hypothetical protein